MEEREQTRFRIEDLYGLRKKYRAGREIRIKTEEIEHGTNGAPRRKVIRSETLTVVKPYERFALCVNEYGTRECFGLFELEKICIPPDAGKKRSRK